MKTTFLLLVGLALAAPAAAQSDTSVAIRPFVVVTEQSFAAVDTFDATFGKSFFPFFGGGLEVVVHDKFFVDVTASRFKQDGTRAYRSGGKNYSLGIPLTATITPLEFTGGYRFQLGQHDGIHPYVAAGVGSYAYQETSAFANTGDDVDTRKTGFVVNGGAEFRVSGWVRLAADVQYTHVSGILGQGGISQQAGETDLGGIAARFKVVVGR